MLCFQVEDAELNWVMGRADVDKNELIDKQELRIAVAIWYTHINFSKKPKSGGGGGGCCGK
eukprot:SAG22_NODE_2062_length_3062_cov_5.668579_2_plen_61_part_00